MVDNIDSILSQCHAPSPMRIPYVIAEIGINHNGSVALACRMITSAKKNGAAAVKFQYFIPEHLVHPEEPVIKLFRKYTFTPKQWKKIRGHARRVGIDFGITPFCFDTLAATMKLKPDFLKIASGDVDNFPLLAAVADQELPLIVSCGASTVKEIDATVKFLQRIRHGWGDGTAAFTLMHCVSLYPCELADANLRRISFLRKRYPGLGIGFSDHTQGIEAALIAAWEGAAAIEKHFTMDASLPGPDHRCSLEPADLRRLTDALPEIGANVIKVTNNYIDKEKPLRYSSRRSPVARIKLEKGKRLAAADFMLLRPRAGILPSADLVGRRVARMIKPGDVIRKGDLTI